jgi:uncharacterized phiE125 gp8 family phage protein
MSRPPLLLGVAMIYTPSVITDSSIEAVSLADFKEHVRVTTTTEDTLMEAILTTARITFENLTGRTVHEKVLEWPLSAWPSGDTIVLPRATPLVSITSIKYKSAAGVESTMAAASYIADTVSTPGRVTLASGYSWPSGDLYPVHPIRVRYVAGIANASPQTEAAQNIQAAIKYIAAALWEHREPEPEPDRIGVLLRRQWGLPILIENLIVHEG